MINRRIQLT